MHDIKASHMPLTLLCMDLPGCAVSRGARVGLDIEDGSRGTRQRPLALARRHFSPAEIATLAGGAALTDSTICARTWQRPLQHTRGSSRLQAWQTRTSSGATSCGCGR